MSEINWTELNSGWSKADKTKPQQREAKSNDVVPDGKYVVDVVDVDFKTGKESGRPYLLWVMDVQEGPHASKRVFKRNMLSTDKNFEWLAKDLHVCNVVLPDDLSDLDTTKLKDLKLAVTVKTKNNYNDIYINRLVDMEDRVNSKFNDDDIPF